MLSDESCRRTVQMSDTGLYWPPLLELQLAGMQLRILVCRRSSCTASLGPHGIDTTSTLLNRR